MFIFIQEHWMSSFEANNKLSAEFSAYEFQTTSSDTFLPLEDILIVICNELLFNKFK